MPNWCITWIDIKHDDQEKLRELYENIGDWTSRNYRGSDLREAWLGNIVLGSGIGTVDTNKDTDLRCRGTLAYSQLCDGELHITTETAWSPMPRMWALLCDKYLPGATLSFTAEECGNGVYCSNDGDVIGKYVIDIWEDELQNDMLRDDWYHSSEVTFDYLKWLMVDSNREHSHYDMAVSEGCTDTDMLISALLEDLLDSDMDGVSIHQMEEASIFDFE